VCCRYFAIFHHEIWRDEAQVWCIVRNVNLSEIFQITKIEGHPMLWYLLVLPQRTKLLKTIFLYFFIVNTLISIPFFNR